MADQNGDARLIGAERGADPARNGVGVGAGGGATAFILSGGGTMPTSPTIPELGLSGSSGSGDMPPKDPGDSDGMEAGVVRSD